MIHPPSCTCETLGCRLRRDGLFSLSSAATPTRGRHLPFRAPADVNHTSWENGVTGEHRPDGSFMPYLDERGGRIHTKAFAEQRRVLDSIRRQQVSGPSVEKVS